MVRAVDQDTLLKALVGAEEVAPETRDFLLKNISSRVAEQLREAMAETGKVRKRDAELAQNEVIRAIRDLVAKGEMKMIAEDDEA